MATFTKINSWVENLHNAGVSMDSDTLQLGFSNTAPGTDGVQDTTGTTNGVLATVTQIAYTNWTDDLTADRVLTDANVAHAHASGTYTLDYTADIVITASGGAIATWQYIYLFNQTVATPTDPLINYWDHGSGIALGDGDSATLQFNASGIYTLA